jgi:pimeloyl-ACP methyl ester carboxylesterase
VLVGHSIGGAIATHVAASHPDWPLIGLALSGVGLNTMPGDAAAWAALPDLPVIAIPAAVKDAKMFGPAHTYGSGAPRLTMSVADAPCPRRELIEIVTRWWSDVEGVAGRVQVPVHYRQGEFDNLWLVDQQQVQGFGRAFAAAPSVDAAMALQVGHCIDYHYLGAAFQLERLAFALRCAAPC